jgi:Xaa-Pro dipeptidase
MVITIEPGIYFNKSLIDKALQNPEQANFLDAGLLRAFLEVGGVRIEDVVVVGEEEALVLSAGAPKEIEEIEALMSNN